MPMRDKRQHMKKTLSVGKALEPAEPIQGLAVSDEKENQPQVDSNLSPERIEDGASSKTALLEQILARQEEFHEVRYWGLNE